MYTDRHQHLGGDALATDGSHYAVPHAGALGAQMVVKRVTKITVEPAHCASSDLSSLLALALLSPEFRLIATGSCGSAHESLPRGEQRGVQRQGRGIPGLQGA